MKTLKAAILTLALICSCAGPNNAEPTAGGGKPEVKAAAKAEAEGKAQVTPKPKKASMNTMAQDIHAKVELPPQKGGPKTRGSMCYVRIDNRTAWYIDIYLNDHYVGTVAPGGDLYGWEPGVWTTCYGVAHFTNAPDLTWTIGPDDLTAFGNFTFHLWP